MTRLKMTITLSPDEEGYLGRQCPSCGEYFAIREHTSTVLVNETTCPYCRKTGTDEGFVTIEQREYIETVVRGEVAKHLATTLSKLGEVTLEESDVRTKRYTERTLETAITCDHCQQQFRIYGVFATCPSCGAASALVVLRHNFNVTRRTFMAAPSDAALSERAHIDALQNVVSAFDAFGRDLTSRATNKNGKTGIALSFQNLASADQRLRENFHHALAALVVPEDWAFLQRVFQKRHVFAHRMGVADQEYLDATGDPDAIVGRKLTLSTEELQRAMTIIEMLASALAVTLNLPIPATPPVSSGTPAEKQTHNPFRLTSLALRLARLLFAEDTIGRGGHSLNVEELPERLTCDELEAQAAVEELTSHNVASLQRRWLSSTHRMPLALAGDLDYAPAEDDRLIARIAVRERRPLRNEELFILSQLPLDRLNRAVRRLHDADVIELTTAMTEQYAFYDLRATGSTLRYLRR
jgi:Zn finger protein HypA/HybF involved in hydrogenase expression